MMRYLPVLIAIMLAIYCITDLAQTDSVKVNFMPKWMWFMAIVVLPFVGGLAWLIFGRGSFGGGGGGGGDPRDQAPDNDPEFLGRL
ncbi:PLD nuclease N-terminal domain-containing protein [Raineyella sp. LH-20]|uniref:PLD nuclease N-terminal domain-containing protein n=1 Tax=Raineyella sp. LH-20 TaxID=3081204 RepID=UPI0029530FD1|nr:PLD nuclease N-terminal domain-containing protein [Raineyella sp. LH-20]WOP19049.1 PLD nuclease N-terminal domain-containing protein [Raineyella sp. LH-20]